MTTILHTFDASQDLAALIGGVVLFWFFLGLSNQAEGTWLQEHAAWRMRGQPEGSRTDLTSPGSSVTSTSVLQLAMGLMDSSTGGTTKLLLTGSHKPWPRL